MRARFHPLLLNVRSRLLERFFILYTGTALVIILPSIDIFLFKNGYIPLIPSATSFLLLTGLVSCNMLIDYMSAAKKICIRAVLRTRPVLMPFTLIVFIALGYSAMPDAYLDHGNRYIKLYLHLFAVFILGAMVVVTPGFINNYKKIFFFCSLALNISVVTDAINPGYFYGVVGLTRPSGFIENANESAMMVSMLCISALDWRNKTILNLVIWITSLAAVFSTLSRSGLTIFLITFFYYLHVHSNWKIFLKGRNVVFMSVLVFVAISQGTVTNMFFESEKTLFREDTAFRAVDALMSLFSDDTTNLEEDIRVTLFFEHLDMIAERPIIGYGMKYYLNFVHGSHNQFLTQWLEYGLLGLLALMFFLFASYMHFKRYNDRRGIAFVIIYFLSSFFSHNLFDSQSLIIILAILTGLTTVEHDMMARSMKEQQHYRRASDRLPPR